MAKYRYFISIPSLLTIYISCVVVITHHPTSARCFVWSRYVLSKWTKLTKFHFIFRMPWQGDHNNLIDRFDVRAHLDTIPVIIKGKEPEEPSPEERQCSYESYRILAQNDFLGITEEKYLHQLHLEEQYGINAQQMEIEKPKKKSGGVTIGYTYDDDTTGIGAEPLVNNYYPPSNVASNSGGNNSQDESDSDIDVDVSIDISKIDTSQAHELNGCGRQYGMTSNDFYSYLTKDADEAESLRMAREEEQEKIMLCGRKSRRERRAQREKRFAGRTISPPSYAAKEEKLTAPDEKADSDSRSPTPENSGKVMCRWRRILFFFLAHDCCFIYPVAVTFAFQITYITSFGGEDELTPHSKISINFNKPATLGGAIASNFSNMKTSGEHMSYADKVKQNLDKLKHLNDKRNQSKSPRKPLAYQRREYSKSRSRSRGRASYSRRHNYGGRTRYRDRLRSSRSSSSRSNHSRSHSRDRHRRRRSRTSSQSSSSTSSSCHHSSKYRRSRNSNTRRRRSTPSTSSSSSSDSRRRSTMDRSYNRRSRNCDKRSRSSSRDRRSATQKKRSKSNNRTTIRTDNNRPTLQAIAAHGPTIQPAANSTTKLTDTSIPILCNNSSQASTLFKMIGHPVSVSIPPPPPPPPLPPQPVRLCPLFCSKMVK